MKKVTNRTLTAMLAFVIMATASSAGLESSGGDEFEGVVTYQITYMKDGEAVKNAMFPSEQKVYIKGLKVCTETSSKATSSKGIVDMEKGTQVVLIEAMGQKLALTVDSKEEMEKLAGSSPEATISETGETREIAGYQCKVAKVEYADGESYEICYTDQISTPNINTTNEMSQVDGFMLQYVKYEPKQGMYISYTATSVEEKPIDETMFAVPDGYTKMDLLEFKGID